MLRLALPGALSRSRWASAFIQRNGPFARAAPPSSTELAVNNSNRATGSGLDHSPWVHALYQPTEPEVAKRTSAIQLLRWTIGAGPGAWKPIRRRLPSGSVASIPPRARRASRWSSTLAKAGETSRAAMPPPTAKPRSARTRCSPLPVIARALAAAGAGRHNRFPAQPRAAAEILVAGVADRHLDRAARALDLGQRQDRPAQELAERGVAADRFAHQRVVHVGRPAVAHGPEADERLVAAPAVAIAVAPDEVALPERNWRRRREHGLPRAAAFAAHRQLFIGHPGDDEVDADVGDDDGDRGSHRAAPRPALFFADPRPGDRAAEQQPDPDVDDEQGVGVKPGGREGGKQLDRIGRQQIHQRMGESRQISQRDQPAEAHRKPAPEARAAADLPAVEQPQQPREQWRHDQHSADQPVSEAAVHRQRLPADRAEEH